MKLFLDEHLSPRIAAALRARGYDVTCVQEVRLEKKTDRVVWERALAEGRVLVTYDKSDFPALDALFFEEEIHHPGLVIISARTIAQRDLGGLVRALEQLLISDRDLADQSVFLQS